MKNRERCRERERLRNEYPGDLFNSSFYAPLTNTVVPGRGSSTITYTRATTAWGFDNEQKLISVPSGCMRFKGARLIYNRIPKSEDLSDASWVKRGAVTATGSQIDPLGGTTAYQLDNVAGSGANDIYCSVTASSITVGQPLYVGFWLKRVSTTGNLRVTNSSGTAYGRFNIDLSALPDGWIYIDKNSPYVVVTNDFVSSDTNGVGIQLYESVGNTISFMLWGITSAALEQVDQSNAQNEYVSRGVLSSPYHGAGTESGADGCKWFITDKNGVGINGALLSGYNAEPGRTNILRQSRDLSSPSSSGLSGVRGWYYDSYGSELVVDGAFAGGFTNWTNISSGTGTATVSGGGIAIAGTDGSNRGAVEQMITGLDTSKFYVIEIELTSFTSGQCTMAIGTGSGTASFLNGWVFATSAGVMRSCIKPTNSTMYLKFMTSGSGGVMTIDNASFKTATTNVVMNETGLDNVANTCVTVTALTNNATVYQSFTAAAATRTFSIYAKRKTGSGTIELTRDGGSSWTDVTSQINSSGFTRVSLSSSVTNPIIGIRLATSGDEIIADCAQDEAGAWASSPIFTEGSTVTRNSDVLTYSSAFNVAQGGSLCNIQSDVPLGSSMYGLGSETSGRLLYWATTTGRDRGSSYDGTTVATSNIGNDINMGVVKRACRWGSDQRCSADGGYGNSVAFNGSMGASGTLYVGCSEAGTSQITGSISNIHIWPTPLTDEQLRQVTK